MKHPWIFWFADHLGALIGVLAATGVGSAGLLMIGVAAAAARRARRARRWVPAPGVISLSAVQPDRTTGDRYAVPVIEYTYTVDETVYRSRRVSYYQTELRTSAAQALCDRYPVGQSVTVYRNPDAPSESVLEPAADGARFQIAIGLIVAAAGWIAVAHIVGVLFHPGRRF